MWAPQTQPISSAIEQPHSRYAAPQTFHPDFGAPVSYQAIERPEDDEQATADTISIMCRVVREDSQDPTIRAIAAAAAGAGSDPLTGIHHWVKSHVRFQDDAEPASFLSGFTAQDTEVLIRPVDLVRMPSPAGDCDDFSMLTAALLLAAGIRAAFVTIAADPQQPDTYSHVYVMAGGRVPVDSSHGPAPGWAAPAAGKSRTWEIDGMYTRSSARQLGDTTTLQDPYGWYSGDTYNPPVSSSPTYAGGSDPAWWQNIVTIGARAGADIAKMAATPTGYYQQIGANGQSITTRQAAGSAFGLPSISTGGNSLMLIGGAALVLVLLMARK